MPKPVRRVTAPNLIAIAQLVRLLIDGTRTIAELAEATGLNINTVQRYCGAFYRARATYICNWRLDSRGAYSIRIYQLGDGADVAAPKQTSLSRAASMRDERKAAKAGKPYTRKTHTRRNAYGL